MLLENITTEIILKNVISIREKKFRRSKNIKNVTFSDNNESRDAMSVSSIAKLSLARIKL